MRGTTTPEDASRVARRRRGSPRPAQSRRIPRRRCTCPRRSRLQGCRPPVRALRALRGTGTRPGRTRGRGERREDVCSFPSRINGASDGTSRRSSRASAISSSPSTLRVCGVASEADAAVCARIAAPELVDVGESSRVESSAPMDCGFRASARWRRRRSSSPPPPRPPSRAPAASATHQLVLSSSNASSCSFDAARAGRSRDGGLRGSSERLRRPLALARHRRGDGGVELVPRARVASSPTPRARSASRSAVWRRWRSMSARAPWTRGVARARRGNLAASSAAVVAAFAISASMRASAVRSRHRARRSRVPAPGCARA